MDVVISGFDARASPRNDVSILIEDANASTAPSDDLGSAPRIARRFAICSIAIPGVRLAGIPPPAPAGFKPELA